LRLGKWIAVLVVIAAGWVAFLVLAPVGVGAGVDLAIAPGTGTAGIAAQLQAAGVIRSKMAFELVREFKGGVLKAGEYRFDHAANVVEVYERIARGDVDTVALVIPEGYNIFEIADAVQAAGLAPRAEFLAAERAHVELIRQWAPGATSLEGYLFPDTYRFARHATPVQMLTVMVKRFGVVAGRLGIVAGREAGPSASPQDDKSKGDVERLVVMASLVEREVHVDAERAVVAGVFENRLALGMPLQTDPAVAYASMLRGTWTGVIHQSELKSNSAYNTYAHAGLPPGPICNPGVAALKAALRPAKTNYLYFVADAKGATKFAATLEEHQRNVAGYRAAVR
jgi:UPF0755 protein